jgi:hypothetical protein
MLSLNLGPDNSICGSVCFANKIDLRMKMDVQSVRNQSIKILCFIVDQFGT